MINAKCIFLYLKNVYLRKENVSGFVVNAVLVKRIMHIFSNMTKALIERVGTLNLPRTTAAITI